MSSHRYLIWSIEHQRWWRAEGQGYTDRMEQAGEYSLLTAAQICIDANYTSIHEVIVPLGRDARIKPDSFTLKGVKS